jgi:hypothetical protein
MKTIRLTIEKKAIGSMGNVIANYLDLEHVGYHPGLSDLHVFRESDKTACFSLNSRIGFWTFKNVHYFEYAPPNKIIQVVKTWLGPMKIESTVVDFFDTKGYSSVTVNVEIVTNSLWFFFRKPLIYLLRRSNERILMEDNKILARRAKIFGASIEDYLKPDIVLLFKKQFDAAFGKKSSQKKSTTRDRKRGK